MVQTSSRLELEVADQHCRNISASKNIVLVNGYLEMTRVTKVTMKLLFVTA